MDPAILFPSIVIIVLVVTVSICVIYIIQTRHIERMTEIEHGMMEDKRSKNRYILNLALLCSSLGGGVLAAYFLMFVFNIPGFIALVGCLLLFGGFGLFAAYYTSISDEH